MTEPLEHLGHRPARLFDDLPDGGDAFEGATPRHRGRKPLPRKGYRPLCELLESRLAPAVVTVTTTADDLTPNDGSVSLRQGLMKRPDMDYYQRARIEARIAEVMPYALEQRKKIPHEERFGFSD